MRSILTFLILLVLACGAFFLLGDHGSSDGSADAPKPEAAASATTPPTPAPPPAPAPLPVVPSDSPGQAATGRQALPGADDTVLVRMVEADGGRPVPGAALYVMDQDGLEELIPGTVSFKSSEFVDLLRKRGQRFRGDARGIVRIPRPKGFTALMGEAPGLFQLTWESGISEKGTLTLELSTAGMITVTVLDAVGRPVPGVPVVVRSNQGFFDMPILIRETDEEGRVMLRNFLQLDPNRGQGDLSVAVAAPLSKEVEVPLDRGALPAEPIVLRLPPTGSVVVEARDLHGKAVPDGTVVVLGSKDRGRTVAYGNGMILPGEGKAVTRNGNARFPVVGLGLTLEAGCGMEGFPKPILAEGAGPTAPGQETRIRLRPEHGPAVLIGRIVDERGHPYADGDLSATLETKEASNQRTVFSTVHCDAHGRFRFLLDPAKAPKKSTRVLTLRKGEPSSRTASKDQPMVVIELAREYPEEERDLGDLVIRLAPLVAAGKVIAPDGSPIPSATVGLLIGGPSSLTGGFSWIGAASLQTKTGPNGDFVLRGSYERAGGQEARLLAQAEGYRGSYANFSDGQTGITLTLGLAGRVRGSVLLDEGIRPRDLQVLLRLLPADGGNEEESIPSWQDREFSWDHLEEGTGSIVFGIAGEQTPIYRVDGITILPGQENQDPRLQEIDLRGRIHQTRLDFVDEGGRRVQQVSLHSLDPEHPYTDFAFGGRKDLLYSSEPPPLLVTSNGYLPVEIRDLRGDRKIVMKKSGELVFVLDSIPPLPEGWSLALSFQSLDSPSSAPRNSYRFGTDGRCRVPAPGAGEWRLQASVFQGLHGNSGVYWDLGQGVFHPSTIRIDDPSTPATFPLRVDRSAFDEGLENVRKRGG